MGDVKANMNESNFLQHSLAKGFNDTQKHNSLKTKEGRVRVVKAYDCQAMVYTDNPIDSKFSLLLEDFSVKTGWHQFAHLDDENMKSTLRALAKFHAFFWIQNGERKEKTSLWDVATYWDLEKQPERQLELLEENFTRIIHEFEMNLDISDKNYGLKLKQLLLN